MSGYKRFNVVLFTCMFVSLLLTVLFSSLASEVLAQETVEDEPEYFMGILILESQQQVILDSIKKVKDLQLGNMATSVDDKKFDLVTIQDQARKIEITWDKTEVTRMEFETMALGVTNVKVYVAYNYTENPVVDADVSVNGKPCKEIESGVYACEINGWSPFQSFLVEVEYPDFEQATKTVSNIHVSNTILYVVIGSVIVLTAAFFVLKKKRCQKKRETESSGMPSNVRLLSIYFRKIELR